MAGQWTPGPWYIKRDSVFPCIATRHPDWLDQEVADTCASKSVFAIDGREEDHSAANAALISAAPDLAEALTGLIGLIELIIPTLEGTQRIGVEDNHRLKDARAALAKAGAL